MAVRSDVDVPVGPAVDPAAGPLSHGRRRVPVGRAIRRPVGRIGAGGTYEHPNRRGRRHDSRDAGEEVSWLRVGVSMLINGSDEQATPSSRSACTARDRQLRAGLGSIRIAGRDLPTSGKLEEVEEELRGAMSRASFLRCVTTHTSRRGVRPGPRRPGTFSACRDGVRQVRSRVRVPLRGHPPLGPSASAAERPGQARSAR
jgi:hypothetical protein